MAALFGIVQIIVYILGFVLGGDWVNYSFAVFLISALVSWFSTFKAGPIAVISFPIILAVMFFGSVLIFDLIFNITDENNVLMIGIAGSTLISTIALAATSD